MARQLQWQGNYNGKAITMARQLQWQGNYNGKAITMARQLQWQGNYNGKAITMARQLQWQGNYNACMLPHDENPGIGPIFVSVDICGMGVGLLVGTTVGENPS